jgi:hypothetical protein
MSDKSQMLFPKNWKPIFFENSRIVVLLSYLAPININAITLGFIVLSREEINETTRRHETIHFQQFLETGFIGFLLLMQIRAEKEAYLNELDENYLENRKRWNWLKLEKIA